MRRGTLWIYASLLGAFLLGLFLMGCGGYSSTPITVTVSPTTVTVIVNGTEQFTATVTGATDTSVTWLVNDVAGGNSTVGTISTTGFYTAPATLPSPATVTVKATANADKKTNATAMVTLDSGVRVSIVPAQATVGTGETSQFSAIVTGTPNTSVNWLVNDVAGGNSTVGTISATGLYTAPATVPSPASVTVKATSVADPSRSGAASTTVVTASDPTLTAINPTSAAQGSLFQDVYLTGTNFLSTSIVLVNGTTRLTPLFSSSTVLRARIPDSLLATGGPLSIQVQRQNGNVSAKQTLTVVPVRPALVGASPDSGTQGGAAFSFNVNGGYFGTTASPAVTAEFAGAVRAASVSSTNSARQLSVTIGSSDLITSGLFSVAVRNSAAAQPVAATNLAVQPSSASIPSAAVATLPVGMLPGAVAVNTATGIAVVVNRGSNNITLIDLTTPTPSIPSTIGGNPNPIPVGNTPTGVAVDNLRNLAVVVNNGDKTVSIVNLGFGTVTSTISLSSVSSAAPFAVGVNPLTGRALVAHQTTNAATLIDLTTSPPSVIGIVTTSTGTNPQVAVEPRLNWAMVTPAGVGSLAIADLGRQTVNAIVANGAMRASNAVTITTTTTHALAVGQPVLITGVTDASFNGTFTVTTVPSSTSFTYAQMGPDATSGNGSASYANALATITLGNGVRGAAINPETEKALLTDPTSTLLLFFSVLEQTVSSLTLEAGAVASAVNPLTDIGVTVNPNTNEASVIDPRTPARLARIPVGTGPKAVAIDPGSNLAVVANETSNNVSILSLGLIRSPQITQVKPPTTLNSLTDRLITIIGKGFSGSPTVQLDGTALPPANVSVVSDRQLNVTVPASFLSTARRYALVVVNGGLQSNVTDFTVIQTVDVTSSGCAAPAPRAVAIDAERNLAVVTNPVCNNVSVIDLTAGTVSKTIAVGTNPQGVAVISRLGKAVVTNRGSSNASIVDLVGGTVTSTVSVGTEPIGVAINQDTATAVVTNSASNTVSTFSADTGGTANTTTVDQRPVAVAIDPSRNLAAVVNATQNNLDLLDLSQSTPVVTARVSGFQLPTAVVFDPVTRFFLVTSSLANNFLIVNPDTQQVTPVRIGINPTSIAYNFESSTLVTVNAASNTVSVMDFLDQRVRAVLGLSASPSCVAPLGPSGNQQQPCGVEIHPRTNIAVMADGDNNRVLLMPLPH